MSDRIRSHRLDLSRRHILRGFGGAAIAAGFLPATRPALAQAVFATNPFQLGVASGDPAADGFVIWTRLAPEPMEIGHGMPGAPVEVTWEVAEDRGFATVAQKGTAVARPEIGHSVHVELTGLKPDRPYWYRFAAGRERSGTGMARTTPAAGAPLARARFAVVGCQSYEAGYFTAHRRMVETSPDFVFCYGDYIYEGRGNRLRNGPDGIYENVRQHMGQEIYSLDDYRRRYAQYKMDPDLQTAHAAAPWFVTWDDHEIDNNWVADVDQDGTDPRIFALRRQAAAQAYYEHMPLRAASLPVGVQMQIFRRAAYGNLLDLNLLDTRQFRSDQPCNDRWNTPCDQVNLRDAEVLGRRQHDWLMANMRGSDARWQVLAQQVMVMDLDRNPGADTVYNLDTWAGYRVPRERLLSGIKALGRRNTVILTGDEHQNYAGEVQVDGKRPANDPVAVEFVATSITSGGDGQDQRAETSAIQAADPQLKFHNDQRGFLLCDVTPDTWRTDYMVLDKVSVAGGAARVRTSITVERGNPRLSIA
ncbi:alkaline phosphatase D family protein [Sphingomonas sp. BGYR3]|uniref:alkaline phosphatase D family protein n=1 Tax=Sphingomonas sp. BGYR3 TaxID=2975483 RepID=UPI0021A8188A|nr:alkaline phosphatase D family protein [Sphingomonas sp. BGYR3]MDG5487226.1 alkaline phosphatase D family protein [Sphingomonas sp. BGYR3]